MTERPSAVWDTIPQMVLSAADRFGDAEAVVDGSLRLTFAELGDRVRVAAGAFAAAGIDRGDRAAIWAPNSAEWIIAAFGLLAAGGVLVPVNTRFKAAEAGDIIRRSGAKAVLVQSGFLGLDYATPPGVPVLDLKSGFLSSGSPMTREVSGDDVCDIVFTSGTTGRPKGVMMTHKQTLRAYAEWCDLAGLREGDRYLIVNPFFHIFGYKAGCIASLIRGATILPVPVFDVEQVLDLVEREKVTVLPGPPTLYHALLSAGGGRDLSSLRVAVTGAADIPVELIRRIRGELPFESIMTGYGLTEAGTVTASRPGDSFADIATTVGTACNDVEIAIAEDGEVLARGYCVMQGYLDDPAATAEAIDRDGWLHTGDLGTLDERGHLRIVGRKKDMFIVGGFNAYPAEIEGFLLGHPAVAQVAVIGVPDERLGQVGKAFVVARGDVSAVSAAELIAWSRERMAGFKVPRSVEFRAELPTNATGKVVKDLLR
jgi:acyl-CoA synthetase (AMP-forming)/AMP-acid ligase II